MEPIGGKKAAALCILKILWEHSDCDHPLTQSDIGRLLEKEYGIQIARNAIGRNISLLLEMGFDISTYEDNGKGSFLVRRVFDDTELLVLIDSVLTSRYIPEQNAKRLIESLTGLGSKFFKKRVRHVSRVSEWPHQRNKQFFFNLEILSEAIDSKKRIDFIYNRSDVDGRLHPTKDERYAASPYVIVCSGGQYYLVCGHDGGDHLWHYRVDRMTEVRVLEDDAYPVERMPGFEHGLDMGKYANQHSFMFGGDVQRVVMKMQCSAASEVVDFFGNGAKMERMDDTYMIVTVHSSLNGMKLFAMQYADVCEVISPLRLREDIKETLRNMCGKYGTEYLDP